VGIIPAVFSREESVIVEQKKNSLIKSLGYLFKNKAFISLMSSYLIIVTTLFSCGALTLYINIYYIFNGDKDTAATLSGIAGTASIAAAFVGMLLIKKISELTGKKKAMIIALSTALFGTGVSWFTLTPAMPYLQLLSGVILGMGVQSCWLLVSSLMGDIIDDDELRTGLRQEGIYSSASGFVLKVALALTAIFSGYVLQFSGFDAGAETTSPEVGYKMKVIFVSLQAVGLLTALGLMIMFPINRQKAEETRRILDERKKLKDTEESESCLEGGEDHSSKGEK
jgi:GPH family glycoside/pentoside/hexuronide:cation symporter